MLPIEIHCNDRDITRRV